MQKSKNIMGRRLELEILIRCYKERKIRAVKQQKWAKSGRFRDMEIKYLTELEKYK